MHLLDNPKEGNILDALMSFNEENISCLLSAYQLSVAECQHEVTFCYRASSLSFHCAFCLPDVAFPFCSCESKADFSNLLSKSPRFLLIRSLKKPSWFHSCKIECGIRQSRGKIEGDCKITVSNWIVCLCHVNRWKKRNISNLSDNSNNTFDLLEQAATPTSGIQTVVSIAPEPITTLCKMEPSYEKKNKRTHFIIGSCLLLGQTPWSIRLWIVYIVLLTMAIHYGIVHREAGDQQGQEATGKNGR